MGNLNGQLVLALKCSTYTSLLHLHYDNWLLMTIHSSLIHLCLKID